jgi:chromatin assembly factor 1 subunit B
MPPLPAIRTPHPSTGAPAAAWAQAPLTPSVNTANSSNWSTTKLYGDENVTSFFRRLTFSPDGNLLFTPAGWFEDNSVNVHGQTGAKDGELVDVEKEKEKEGKKEADATSSSCVYVYSKANFSKSPIAAYPGHKRAVVCVKFSNILYDLRSGVTSSVPPTPSSMTGPGAASGGPITISLEPGKEDVVDMGLNTPVRGATASMVTPRSDVALPSPALSTVDLSTPSQTPKKLAETSSMIHAAVSEGSGATASVFTLPYRMMFAVATQETVAIHDTQQAGPICLLSKLHYDSFTDMAW